MITQYIYKNRNGKRQKVGMLVGVTKKDKICIGFSLCCACDKFDKTKALSIAAGRAASDKSQACPPSIVKDVIKFAIRCEKYFQDAHLVVEKRDEL